MVRATSPKVVVLLNLSRDQMDRAAEIWLLARRWREALGNARMLLRERATAAQRHENLPIVFSVSRRFCGFFVSRRA